MTAFLIPGIDFGGRWTPSNLNNVVQRFGDQQALAYAGTLQSFPYLTPEEPGTLAIPRSGRCYNFDGIDDYATGGNSSLNNWTAITICFWVKRIGSQVDFSRVFEKSNENEIEIYWFNNRIGLGLKSTLSQVDPNVSPSPLPDGTWTHVAFTISSTYMTHLYLNGVFIQQVQQLTPVSKTNTVGMGRYFGGGYHINASVYDVRMYGTVKTGGEVAAIYNQHLTPSTIDTADLLGWWPCQEESGTTAYDASGNGNHLTLTNITQSTFHATDTGVKWSAPNSIGHTVSGSVIIPRNEATPSLDAAGNALGVTGPVKHPATTEVPCVTLASHPESVVLPNIASNFTTEATMAMLIKRNGNPLFGGGIFGTAIGDWYPFTDTNVYLSTFRVSRVGPYPPVVSTEWHWLIITTKPGANGYKIFQNLTLIGSSTGESSVYLSSTPTMGLSSADGSGVQIGGLFLWNREITEPERTALVNSNTIPVSPVVALPVQDGPGSSSTNRTMHDASGNGYHATLVNGTVSDLWTNRTAYAQDWCIRYGGGIAANGAFVPGRIGSSLDAAGNAKTLAAGKHGNPYSRLCPNTWSAPELVNIGYTSSTKLAPSDAVQATSPADTKFRRNKTDGSDRYFATSAPLTGSNKTNAEAYTS